MSRLSDAKRQIEALHMELDESRDEIAILQRDVPGVIWAKMRQWQVGKNSMLYDFRAAVTAAIREGSITREEVIDWLVPSDEERS